MSKAKILWVDTETTGTDPSKHGVHQVAGVIDSFPLQADKQAIEEFNIKANPFPHKPDIATWEVDENGKALYGGKKGITKNALQVSGVTREQVEAYPEYGHSFSQMMKIFSLHVNKFEKKDKFILAGYNINFDKDMIAGWAKSVGEKYIFSYIDHRVIDVQSIVRGVYAMGLFPCEPDNFKLEYLAPLFGITIDAHDALSDIKATRELYFKMIELIGESQNTVQD